MIHNKIMPIGYFKIRQSTLHRVLRNVLARFRNYLQQLGTRIDEILKDHKNQGYKKSKLATMRTRLWDHVPKFSNLTGEQLWETYIKMKEDMGRDGACSSH